MTKEGNAAADVAFANRLATWLHTANVGTTEMSVDFSDIVSASRFVQAELEQLMKLDIHQPDQAATALDCLGRLHAWLFTEIKHHIEELEKTWPGLEGRVAALTPSSD
jgi:hypothetical protein